MIRLLARGHRGFSLSELIITIAVVSILAGAAAPSFVRMAANHRLESSTIDLLMTLREIRASALNGVGSNPLPGEVIASLGTPGKLTVIDSNDGITSASYLTTYDLAKLYGDNFQIGNLKPQFLFHASGKVECFKDPARSTPCAADENFFEISDEVHTEKCFRIQISLTGMIKMEGGGISSTSASATSSQRCR